MDYENTWFLDGGNSNCPWHPGSSLPIATELDSGNFAYCTWYISYHGEKEVLLVCVRQDLPLIHDFGLPVTFS